MGSNVFQVLADVFDERDNQDRKWGEQNHPNGTGGTDVWPIRDQVRAFCDRTHSEGVGTWTSILAEEVLEAFAEEDPDLLRAELIQVAAVAAAWVQCIDRRGD